MAIVKNILKKDKIILLSILLILSSLYAEKQMINGYSYEKPTSFQFLRSMPQDYKDYYNLTVNREYLPEFLLVALSTGLLIAADEKLIVEAKKIGSDLGIASDDKTKTFFRVFDLPIRFPTDLGSSLYFIGDGWTHLGLSAGFYMYGKLSDDNRALQTASQIAEGMATAGLLTQIIKHITGRVSPYRSEDGHTDKWTPFPNQIEYHKHVSSYDAFPSGHMAVCMATVTVIAENYPEYTFIWPVGYTAMTLLGFQMMNNGVHWISDYPLALAMGYQLGKIAVKNGRKKIDDKVSNFSISPYISSSNSIGINLMYNFN